MLSTNLTLDLMRPGMNKRLFARSCGGVSGVHNFGKFFQGADQAAPQLDQILLRYHPDLLLDLFHHIFLLFHQFL